MLVAGVNPVSAVADVSVVGVWVALALCDLGVWLFEAPSVFETAFVKF